MKSPALEFVVVLLLALVSDVVAAVHIKALVQNSFLWGVASVVLLNYCGFFAHLWFVEHDSFKRRLLITTAMALGAGVGSAIVIGLFS